jgi:hypothetical protein
MLVCYPHGLGDCVLLTPALREYYFKTGKKASVATLERFKSAKFFDYNPYVDKIFYTKDAWLDYPTFEEGCAKVYESCVEFAKQNEIIQVTFPQHKTYKEKILSNYVDIGLKACVNPTTEIYTCDEDVSTAAELIEKLVGHNRFGFVQTSTGVPQKDLPAGYGREWLKKNLGLSHFIEVGVEFDGLSLPITTQFEIMRRASGVCVPDSVFYHACGAMHKPVDFVYFAKGQSVYDRVRPLHGVKQNIKFELDEV